MKKEETVRTVTPPYLSVAKIERTIELVSNRNFTEVNVPLFVGYGFNKIDAQLAVSMLRFLGVINEEGESTDLMPKLRLTGEARKTEFEKIVRAAYKKLFGAVDNPQNLPSDDLRNEFVVQYHLSSRVVRTAIPAFIKLCEYAGLKEEGSVVGRIRRPAGTKSEKAHQVKQSVQPKTAKNASGRTHRYEDSSGDGHELISVADGRLLLSAPIGAKDKLLNADDSLDKKWREAKGVLRELADMLIPAADNPKSEESGAS